MYTELHMENIFEIGRGIECVLRLYDQCPWEDSKDMFMDALKWAQEFEEQYDDNGGYYDAIDKFVRQKIEDKFKEYWKED